MNLIESNGGRIVQTLAREFPSRSGIQPKVLHAASEFIEKEFQNLGFNVSSQEYRAYESIVRNLIIEQPGSQPHLPCIVLGAHYDTVLDTPGADDNASGVAGLLELARLLKSFPNKRTIRFVAFTHEEPPYFYTSLMGSRQYAQSLKDQSASVHLMLSLEMLGYGGEQTTQYYPFPLMRQIGRYPKYGNYIALVSNLRSMRYLGLVRNAMRRSCEIGVECLAAPGWIPPLFLSDHSSFWKHDFPALMITDTAFLRNPHYHRPSDTADTLNYEFLAEVVKGLQEAMMTLDGTRE
ncbi:MAG: M20/M25/M40 family metallo-hydrolase [bacterium]